MLQDGFMCGLHSWALADESVIGASGLGLTTYIRASEFRGILPIFIPKIFGKNGSFRTIPNASE